MNELALCAGVGGMSLGVGLVAPGHSAAAYVEGEAYAVEILAARMEDGAIPAAPVWSDLTSFDARPFRGCVDLVTSGLPCQPYSVAGKRLADEDDRALWPHFVRVVEECEPGAVFLENVPGFRKHFEPVWRELRRLGFKWAPPLLSTASESGAPHIRERFFALAAHPERIDLRIEPRRSSGSDRPVQAGPRTDGQADPDSRESGLEGRGVPGCERADERAAGALGNSPSHATGERERKPHDPSRAESRKRSRENPRRRGSGHGGAPPDPDRDHGRREREWCGWVFDGERQTLRHDTDRCGDGCRIRGTLWDSESPTVKLAARASSHVDELRAIGNVGTPPVVYARAFIALAERLAR